MKFSIVIAVAPERNAEVLKSFEKVNYPRQNYEIIVERGRNPSDNRNRGVEKSKSEIIAFIDDDALVDRDILKEAEQFFKNHEEIDIVGGPQLTPKDDRRFAKISGYALASKFGGWKTANRYSAKKMTLEADETMLTSANLFCRKKVFAQVKFDPKLFPGEDPAFIAEAKKAGFNVAYSPEIIVYHRRRSSFSGLIKQIYNYGKTRPRKESLGETIKMPFFLVPSLFLIYLVVLLAISSSNIARTGNVIGGEISEANFHFLILIPLVLYLVFSLSFSLINAIANKDFLAFLLLPIIYLAIHLSYGAGFLMSSMVRLANEIV